ncbi:uncharacterized protein LOC124190319 [Daphnia pulex]|uniref:uncharacterized protein LOC124190319 n=1 Tax=Daphnia pulex TaxID=6669 RepID=UPI001EDD9EC5|nr:uncharacterized protein LOC124190319 [Daphnia pulex]
MFESLMDTVIPNVKSSNHTQTKPFGEKYCQKQTVTIPNSCAKTKTSPSKSEYLPPNVVISSPAVTQVVSVSSPTMPNQQENQLSPAPCRTVSESSESSWASVSPEANQDVLLSNPWLRNIVVCVGDSDDSDESDSDWDCVEDFQSENGEVISDFKWNGDSLSPISSPVSQTPPVPAAALDDYDSDESDGVLISCGSGYVFDDEEEARERKLSEERIQDANRRWDRNLSTAVDETDGIRKTSRSKQVHFPVDSKLTRIRPMLTWTHAHRAARKGDWERFARDADRFRERIDSTAAILAPILDPSHRDRVRRRNLKYDADHTDASHLK